MSNLCQNPDMKQAETPDFSKWVGYRLKQVHSELRAAMDAELRGHGLTVPQYACLELLAECPGRSNAELARGAFVTRQSMNVVLRGLQDSGLIERADTAEHGRARPARLSAEGYRRLQGARAGILAVEQRLTSAFTPGQVRVLMDLLDTMVRGLRSGTGSSQED